MSDTFIWKTDRPWPNPRLKCGAIVGHTTSKSSRIWIRTGRLGVFNLLVFELNDETKKLFGLFKKVPCLIDEIPQSVKRYTFTISDYNTDTTYVVDTNQLKANTEYGYALHGMDSQIPRILLGQDRPYTFRTMPNKRKLPFSFGFYSCHMPYKDSFFGNTNVVNLEMWDYFHSVLSEHHKNDLRFVIGGGDQVYVDGVNSLNIWNFLHKVARKEDGNLLPELDSMKSWYRDIYRGYWGFANVQAVHSSYPNYMTWDDHELKDGWGSYKISDGSDDELNEIFDWQSKGLTRNEALELIARMKTAGFKIYEEYQHAHNPDTPSGQFDYELELAESAFYFLDSRSSRDINKRSRRVLGQGQYRRFNQWLERLDVNRTPFVFIISAVPVMHLNIVLANADANVLADLADLQDDLRDSWEHGLHDSERKGLLKALFSASKKGFRICILSGDVHTSAAFKMLDEQNGSVIYQLTSSAITYNKPRVLSWVLGKTVADSGRSDDGYQFKRLALYTDSNFSIINVDPKGKCVWFKLYGKQTVADPNGIEADLPVKSEIVNLELKF